MFTSSLTRLVVGAAVAVGLTMPAVAQSANTLSAADKNAGWKLLFDGSSLTGWRGFKKPDASGTRWSVKDGALCLAKAEGADTHGARDIITSDTFNDFDLRWEWRVEPGSNSGLKYFISEDRDAGTLGGAVGHEYQLIDDRRHPDAKISTRQTASFYDVKAATSHPTKPVGQWNSSRVVVNGNHVEHWLNERKVLEYELGSPETLAAVKKSKFKDVGGFGTKVPGHILLQDHGEAVCYRSLRIRAGTT